MKNILMALSFISCVVLSGCGCKKEETVVVSEAPKAPEMPMESKELASEPTEQLK